MRRTERLNAEAVKGALQQSAGGMDGITNAEVVKSALRQDARAKDRKANTHVVEVDTIEKKKGEMKQVR